jgi:hypothetical protein
MLKKTAISILSTLKISKENYMKQILYRTDCVYTCVRRGYSEQDTWRDALGVFEPLLAYADKLPTLDAPDYLPAGHTTKKILRDFASRE